jgi:hypothetical protein
MQKLPKNEIKKLQESILHFAQGSWIPGEENLMNNEYYKSLSNSSFNWQQMYVRYHNSSMTKTTFINGIQFLFSGTRPQVEQ